MGHIIKRLGRYQATYRGPDRKERTRTFDRRRDAERWLSTVTGDVARGQWVDPRLSKVTFAEYADQWLTTKADVAPRTLINVQGRLQNHAVPFFGNMEMGGIQPTHVRSWVAGMVATELAPSTVKASYLTCSQVFEQATVDGILARSPCRGIDLPKDRQHEEMHFLEAEEVARLAEAIGERYRTLVFAAAYTGLRAGELGALKLTRLNLLTRTLEVVESTAEVRGRLVVGPTKTGRPRTVALPRFLAQMLGEHVGQYPSSEGFVFTAAQGGPIRHRNFYQRHFQPAVLRAGLPPGLRFHDLRHTCAALLIANGRHMEEVKAHLGHSSIRVTSDRYGHLFPRARQALAEELDATFLTTSAQDLADKPRTSASVTPLPSANEGPGKGP